MSRIMDVADMPHVIDKLCCAYRMPMVINTEEILVCLEQ